MKAFRLLKTEGTTISGTGVELRERETGGDNYFLIFSRIGMI